MCISQKGYTEYDYHTGGSLQNRRNLNTVNTTVFDFEACRLAWREQDPKCDFEYGKRFCSSLRDSVHNINKGNNFNKFNTNLFIFHSGRQFAQMTTFFQFLSEIIIIFYFSSFLLHSL